MKYCLYDFFEEGSIEIGSTDLVEVDVNGEFDETHFNNEEWNWEREVLVNWPSSKQPNAKQQGKAKGKSARPTYVARIVLFSDDRRDQVLLDKCRELQSGDHVDGIKTRAGRPQKRPQRYISSSSSDEEDDRGEATSNRQLQKAKKAKLTACKESRDNDLLARLANKKQEEKKAEENEVAILRNENASLKEEIRDLQRERDGLVTALACIKELPELLQEMRERKVHLPSTSKAAPPPTPRPPPRKPEKTVSMQMAGGKAAPLKVLQALMANAFPRGEMATHSLTGTTSNANAGKEARPQLNPAKMEEIFKAVQEKFPDVPHRDFREAARNKLSNEKKLYKRAQAANAE